MTNHYPSRDAQAVEDAIVWAAEHGYGLAQEAAEAFARQRNILTGERRQMFGLLDFHTDRVWYFWCDQE